MSGSRLYRDEGVVLRTYKLGEADRIVVLATQQHGKVRAVAKGVRKTRSKFGARLEPLSHVALQLYEGRNLDTITQVEGIDAFRPIRDDLDRYGAAMTVLEVSGELPVTGVTSFHPFDGRSSVAFNLAGQLGIGRRQHPMRQDGDSESRNVVGSDVGPALQEGVRLSRRLEKLFDAWRHVFVDYYTPQTAMQRWFEELSDRGIFTTDASLRIQSWNQWLTSRSGLEAGALVGPRVRGALLRQPLGDPQRLAQRAGVLTDRQDRPGAEKTNSGDQTLYDT